MLNELLDKKGYQTIKAGIDLDCDEDIIVKVGLERDFDCKPATPLREDFRKFAEWYKCFYH